MAEVTTKYAASANMTVTALESLTSSATWTAGWESPIIDNSSTKYVDILVSAKIVFAGAGEVRIYVAGMLDDSTWPGVLDGTASTEDWTDTEERDSACKLGAAAVADGANTHSIAPFSLAQLFGGVCPEKCVLFITSSGTLSTGNQVTTKGITYVVA